MTRIIFEAIIKLLVELNINSALSSDRKKKLLKQALLPIVKKCYSHDHFRIVTIIVDLINACDTLSDHKEQEELLKRVLSILNIKS